MGVQGLTTYLRENASLVSKPVVFSSVQAVPAEDQVSVPIIVDAWGLIYVLLELLPWPYGGEHLEFARLLQRTVEGWRAVGLEPIFVFDGPAPPIKFATELSRQASLILPISLFHLTSPASRSARSSWSSQIILPPLLYSAAVEASLSLGVETIWAESEADVVCAYLAERRNGYIAGADSDFVIYGSQREAIEGEGGAGRGYIPLNEMKWDWVDLGPEEEASDALAEGPAPDDGGDFKPFKSKTSRRNERKGQNTLRKPSPVPPPVPNASFLTSLSVNVYTPSLLAARLKLPLSILPLFAALIGNDYFKYGQAFHQRGSTIAQKVERVSSVLRDCLGPKAKKSLASNKSGTSTPTATSGDAALLLLSNATNALLLHPRTEGEIEPIIHALIESALSYSIPLDLPTLPLFPSSSAQETPFREDVLKLYADAMRQGDFVPKLAGVVRDGRYVGRLFLEDTTRASINKKVGEGVREACWAVLDQGLGIGFDEKDLVDPVFALEKADAEVVDEEKLGEGEEEEEKGEEEGGMEVEVVEEGDAQPEETSATLEAGTEELEEASEDDALASNTPFVQTYLRSSTILHPNRVPITPLPTLLDSVAPDLELDTTTPLVIQSLPTRSQAYLHLLGSPDISIRDELKPLVVTVRWILRRLADESQGGMKHRFRRGEIKALLLTGVRSFHAWAKWDNNNKDKDPLPEKDEPPKEITNRNVHVTSHFLHALHEINLLAQTLLIPHKVLPAPHRFYSGKLLHNLLGEWEADPAFRPAFASEEEERDFQSCLKDVLDEEATGWVAAEPVSAVVSSSTKREKKKAKKDKASAAAAAGGGGAARGRSMFELLGEMEC